MERRTKVAVILAAIATVAIIAGIAVFGNNGDTPATITCKAIGYSQMGDMRLDIVPSDMDTIGATFGDNIRISSESASIVVMYADYYNGIPSFEGFITFNGGLGCIGYFNTNTREALEFQTGDTLTLSREGRNAYVDLMPNYVKGYSKDPEDYDSPEIFSNFREVSGGDLIPGTIYRSASPWTSGTRSTYADDFYRANGIDSMICLDKDADQIEEYVEEVPDAYASDLFKEGKVACRCLSPSTHAHPEECRFVIDSFLEAEGKIGISCSWGKDRTGVYCALLEGLAGATYDEIRADFMLSFCNMYHIEEGSTEYDVVAEIIVDRFFYLFDHMECIPHPEDVDWEHIEFVKYNPEEVFTKYLIEHVGLDEGTVQKVKDKLTGRI